MKKGIIIGIICLVVVVALVVAAVVILGGGGSARISSDNKLAQISFNGVKIGDKIKDEMKNQVTDASYLYKWEEVCIDVDEKDRIEYLAFFSYTSFNNSYGSSPRILLRDANITYGEYDIPLRYIADIKEVFGRGQESGNTIVYEEGNLRLTISLKNNEVYSMVLEVI